MDWRFDQKLNVPGTLLCAGPTSTGQLAWPWQTPDACWSTSSQSPPSPSPSTSPSSWRWQWLSTMEQTRLTLPRQERIQPSFSGEIYKFIYTSTFNAWQITGGIHSTRPNGISIFLGKVHTFTDVASNADNRGASLPRPPLYELTHLFHDQVVFSPNNRLPPKHHNVAFMFSCSGSSIPNHCIVSGEWELTLTDPIQKPRLILWPILWLIPWLILSLAQWLTLLL